MKNTLTNPKTTNTLSHIDAHGQPCMVDVSAKNITTRNAKAYAEVVFPADVFHHLQQQHLRSAKGSILDCAQIAGIMAAKKTSDLIPMCHPLPIENCKIEFSIDSVNNMITINTSVTVTHKTGVEMEALTAASVAALTIYDMCKALSHDIRIKNIRLLEKSGGKSDIL